MVTDAAREIATDTWDEFCRRLSALHKDAVLEMELIDHDNHRRPIADQALFQRMMLDRSGPCIDRLTIEFASGGGTTNAYVITDPFQLVLREAENNRYRTLEIRGEEGTSILTFRPGVHPATLDGIV